jgi:hypothetical protein
LSRAFLKLNDNLRQKAKKIRRYHSKFNIFPGYERILRKAAVYMTEITSVDIILLEYLEYFLAFKISPNRREVKECQYLLTA